MADKSGFHSARISVRGMVGREFCILYYDYSKNLDMLPLLEHMADDGPM